MNEMNAWTLALANISVSPRSGTIKCESEVCNNYFDPPSNVPNKRFCSESCRQHEKVIRRRAAYREKSTS